MKRQKALTKNSGPTVARKRHKYGSDAPHCGQLDAAQAFHAVNLGVWH